MVSAVRKLTSVGGDVRQIARLLQKKAPPGHMLAYINQEEADLLKARGGSGEPHADTGIPSFDDYDLPATTGETEMGPPVSAANFSQEMGPPASAANPPEVLSGATPVGEGYAGPITATSTPVRETFPTQAAVYGGDAARPNQYGAFGEAPTAPQAKPDLDLLGKLKSTTGLGEESLKKLGIGGLQALIGGYQANQARQAGQQSKEELSSMAAPYRQQGSDIIAKAQRGELTPVGQQQLQAVQAQAAQGAEKRGGVGAQQSMAQVEAFRQQLLQQQYDYGLKLSGIADNIMTGAIKTGIQADQYVNNLTSNYFSNIARTLYGTAPQAATPAAPTGAA